MHIVRFDSNHRISQIRLYWDQGSLLKLVDVIGARARNWPIRDGKDQARLIASCAAGTIQSNGSVPPNSNKAPQESTAPGKPRSQSTNVTRDPHATLELFAPRREEENAPAPAVVAPRGSAKPPPRDLQDLFGGNDPDTSPRTKASAVSPQRNSVGMRLPKAQTANPAPRDYHDLFVSNGSGPLPAPTENRSSPSKSIMSPGAIASKGGAGKNFKPSRLFETDEDPGTPKSPERSSYKPHPQKYDHFEFGKGEDAEPAQPRPKTKHQNQWDFEDFMTPQKLPTKVRDQDKRQFGWEDDEPVMDSPAKHPPVAKARPDAAANFQFQDDGTPVGERRAAGLPRGQGNVRTTGLYQNNLFDENDEPPSPEKKVNPLSTVTNLKDRRKDFDPHFAMTDSSPSAANESKSIPENRAKVVSQMGAQWEAGDESPQAPLPHHTNPLVNDKENFAQKRMNDYVGIKSGGDGMGGKKGAGRNWGFGDDSDEDGIGGANGGKFQASKKQQAPQDNGIWDF